MSSLADVWLALTPGFFAKPFLYWALAALALDIAIGDPVFRFHPIRLLGDWLRLIETVLFDLGWNGYVGGVLLFVLLTLTTCAGVIALGALALKIHPWAFHAFVVAIFWSTIALRDLIGHGVAISKAVQRSDLPAARRAASMLVGRDTEPMDAPACMRAGIESIAENFVDGVLSPLLFAIVAGPFGAVIYKIASTMDSMVGYRTPRYQRFGWCGARLDDALNFIPARLSWLLLAAASLLVPGCDSRNALRWGWRDHRWLPSPNSGWPEAAMAGALSRRLAGPIFCDGVCVNTRWIGAPDAPEGGSATDLKRSVGLVATATLLAIALAAPITFFFP